jgi:hypothetical protein
MEKKEELLRETMYFDEAVEDNYGFMILPCFNVMPKNKEEFRDELEKSLRGIEGFEGFEEVDHPYNGGICRCVIKIFFAYPRQINVNEGQTLNEAEIAIIKGKIPLVEEKCREILENIVLE